MEKLINSGVASRFTQTSYMSTADAPLLATPWSRRSSTRVKRGANGRERISALRRNHERCYKAIVGRCAWAPACLTRVCILCAYVYVYSHEHAPIAQQINPCCETSHSGASEINAHILKQAHHAWPAPAPEISMLRARHPADATQRWAFIPHRQNHPGETRRKTQH